MALNNIDAAAESLENALQFEPNDGESLVLLVWFVVYAAHLSLFGGRYLTSMVPAVDFQLVLRKNMLL